MQLLSQATVLADLAAQPPHPRFLEFAQRPEVRHLANAFVVQSAVAQVVTMLAYWIASKAVAPRDMSVFLNALKLWLFYWLFWIVFFVGVFFLAPAILALRAQDNLRAELVAAGVACFTFLMIFLIPMKLYVIGFLRALLFLVLAGLITLGLMTGANFIILKAMGAEKDIVALRGTIMKPGSNPQHFLERLAGKEAPDEIDRLLDDALDPIGPPPPLARREAMVRELQLKLEARRRTMPPGAPPSPAFQNELTRYLQLLNEVKAERSAPTGPPSAASPAPAQATPGGICSMASAPRHCRA